MTLKPLELYSEPYGTTGNIGENLGRLLGAPTLDPLQTVVREALQNIADAAKLGAGPEVLIRLRTLQRDQRELLLSQVLQTLPDSPRSREMFKAMVAKPEIVAMEICDFRTVGLGGPTRSDRIPVDATCTDFINFLRNIGTPRDAEQGGGTYGFGKVALYRQSGCSTILVDSLPHGTNPPERRFMGCHLGPSFEVPEDAVRKCFTGRHWWGRSDQSDGVVDPVTGQDAEALASGLGLPPRNGSRTGTSIMILDFETEGESLASLGSRIVEALLYNFWPRMMRDTPPERRFTCNVEVDGMDLPIPCPEDFPPLDLFTKAMRAARTGKGNDVEAIVCGRPRKALGILARERGLCGPRRPLVDGGSLFPHPSRHIALMRPVELVVKYLEGTALPDERLEWAGVFIADEQHEVERAFADAEPPAHDDWIPDNLPKGNAKTFVNVGMRELRRKAAEFGGAAAGRPRHVGDGPPLARVAARLGAALEGVIGDGAGRNRTNDRKPTSVRPPRARATPPVFMKLEATGSDTVAVFSTEVQQDAGRSGRTLTACAAISIEGAAAVLDGQVEIPVIVSICSYEGDIQVSGASSIGLDGREGVFEIRVKMPPDCAVSVDAEVM